MIRFNSYPGAWQPSALATSSQFAERKRKTRGR
jgi:hypothetical protein